MIQYVDERLKELDEEKAELKDYQQLDKQRKSLEYSIYDKQLNDAQRELDEVKKIFYILIYLALTKITLRIPILM